MRILVIFTGGTIGSSVKGKFIATDGNKKYKIIESYTDGHNDISFDTLEPYTILSENLMGHNINMLAQCIRDNCDGYQGIIVTHGTDTLQYTASGLSLMLSDIGLPVVLVSSNYILEDKRANGITNFFAAVSFIKAVCKKQSGEDGCEVKEEGIEACKGVFVAYNNGGNETYIHLGSMVIPHRAYEDRIFSHKDNYVGTVISEEFIPNIAFNYENEKKKILESFAIISSVYNGFEKNTNRLTCYEDLCKLYDYYEDISRVSWLREHPGFRYDIPSKETKCVLLETYHSGTLCAENKALRDMLEVCRNKKLPVFVIGVENRIQYESTKFFEEYDLNILPELSTTLAYMMLWGMQAKEALI